MVGMGGNFDSSSRQIEEEDISPPSNFLVEIYQFMLPAGFRRWFNNFRNKSHQEAGQVLKSTPANVDREKEKLKEEIDGLYKDSSGPKDKSSDAGGADHISKLILVACMPKSGSTFFTKLISGMSDFPITPFYSNGGAQEMDVLAINALQSKHYGVVSHQHLIGSECAVKIINDFNISVIILERNILDIVASLRDALASKGTSDALKGGEGRQNRFSFFIDSSFLKVSEYKQYNFVIDLAVPWYLKFFVSWREYKNLLDSPPLWMNYETFFSDLRGSMEKIGAHCDLPINASGFEEVLSGVKDTRFNVGESGRGRKILSEQQIEKVETLIWHYPDFANELIQWDPVKNDLNNNGDLIRLAICHPAMKAKNSRHAIN